MKRGRRDTKYSSQLAASNAVRFKIDFSNKFAGMQRFIHCHFINQYYPPTYLFVTLNVSGSTILTLRILSPRTIESTTFIPDSFTFPNTV